MKNKFVNTVKPYLALLISALLLIIAIVLPITLDNAENSMAENITLSYERTVYDKEYNEIGVATGDFIGTEISAIGEISSILYVNHIPEQFVTPSEGMQKPFTAGKIERLDKLTKAAYGTLQFFFFNLDPMSENFAEQAEELSRFRTGTQSTAAVDFYLPFAFDAATVFCHNSYVFTAGNMGDYSPTDYLDSYVASSFVPNNVTKEAQHLTLSFPLSQRTIDPDRFHAARIVTVHYLAKDGVSFAGALPLAGAQNNVKSAVNSRLVWNITFLAVVSFVAVAFLALSLLKRNRALMGACGISVCGVLFLIASLIPLLGQAVTGTKLLYVACSLLPLFALLSSRQKAKGWKEAWVASLAVSAINAVLSLVFALTVFSSLNIYYKVATPCLSAIAVAFGILSFYGDKKPFMLCHNVIAGISATTAVFIFVTPIVFLPASTLCISLSALTALYFIINDIFRTERRNRALTENLQIEVATQTNTLKNALSDRERILSFLSHDLRKSSISIQALTDELARSSPNDHVTNLTGKIQGKNKIVLESLSEILQYAKRNYSDEPFDTVPLADMFDKLSAHVAEDCKAYGITLHIPSTKLAVFAKPNSLFSTLFNLVFNAMEHAHCTQISITARRAQNNVIIRVHDNGQGLPDGRDVFTPTPADSQSVDTLNEDSHNTGLGLLLVKSELEAMGGKIIYEQKEGSAFVLTLPYAVI
ncbi:MAG: MFS domain-containing histidine kinase [Candidatus Coproplasma sp.]